MLRPIQVRKTGVGQIGPDRIRDLPEEYLPDGECPAMGSEHHRILRDRRLTPPTLAALIATLHFRGT